MLPSASVPNSYLVSHQDQAALCRHFLPPREKGEGFGGNFIPLGLGQQAGFE